MRRAIEWVVGSVGIYVLVAACAAATANEKDGEPGGDDEPGGHAGQSSGSHGGGTSGGGGGTSGGGGGSSGGGPSILDPVADAFAAEPGSRLKPRFHQGGDGSKAFAGEWFDTARNEVCRFTQTESGLRCVPAALGVVAVGNNVWFSNSGCTMPLASMLASAGCAAPKYATGTSGTVCTGNHTVLYSVAPTPHTGQVYMGSPNDCRVWQNQTSYVFYAATRIPDTAFVEATVSH